MRSPTRALVVDDDSLAREYVCDLLNKIGIASVYEAANGHEARDQVKQHDVDLVFLDVNMTPVNGLEFLKAVRMGLTAAPRNLPVIMMTINKNIAVINAAGRLDCSAFLTKPASTKEVANNILNVLRRQISPRPVRKYSQIVLPDLEAVKAENGIMAKVKSWLLETPRGLSGEEDEMVFPPFIDYDRAPPDNDDWYRPVKQDRGEQHTVVKAHNLTAGDVLQEPLYTSDGFMLLNAGTRLNGMHIHDLQHLPGTNNHWTLKVRRSR